MTDKEIEAATEAAKKEARERTAAWDEAKKRAEEAKEAKK